MYGRTVAYDDKSGSYREGNEKDDGTNDQASENLIWEKSKVESKNRNLDQSHCDLIGEVYDPE